MPDHLSDNLPSPETDGPSPPEGLDTPKPASIADVAKDGVSGEGNKGDSTEDSTEDNTPDDQEQTFVIDDEDRYSRVRLIAWWDQDKLSHARILVVGAGALGNEVLKNLALLGIGQIDLVDFDHIEESNLTRTVLFRQRDCGRPKAEVAAEAIRDLNPEVRIRARTANVTTDVGLGVFRDADVVIGCLDNREARLWVNRCCWKVGTPWIDGGIQEINGVAKVFVPPDGACYECAMTETDYRLINLRYSCPLLRQEDLLAGKVPTAPTISSMIGGLQTQEALKLIHGMPVAEGEALVYNGVANQFYKTAFQHRADCLSHETYDPIVELPLRSTDSARDAMRAGAEAMGVGAESTRLELDRDLVVSIKCENCDHHEDVMRPIQLVGMRQAECPGCGETCRPQLVHNIDWDGPLAERPLSELGVPAYDVVQIATADKDAFVLLAGDRSSANSG